MISHTYVFRGLLRKFEGHYVQIHFFITTGIGRKNDTNQEVLQMIWNIPIKDPSRLPDS